MESKPITEQELAESSFTPQIDWSRRFTDPAIKFKWNSAIETIPANKEKGIMTGAHIFPDGTRSPFTVQ